MRFAVHPPASMNAPSSCNFLIVAVCIRKMKLGLGARTFDAEIETRNLLDNRPGQLRFGADRTRVIDRATVDLVRILTEHFVTRCARTDCRSCLRDPEK